MAKNSLSDFSSIINQLLVFKQLLEQLFKIKALINVSLDENFLDYSERTIRNYLRAVSNIAYQARGFCEHGLNSILRELSPINLKRVGA